MVDENEMAAGQDAETSKPRKVGVVTGDKMQKTRTVVLERLVKHRLYSKYIRRRTVLKVHDEENVSKVGDRVEVGPLVCEVSDARGRRVVAVDLHVATEEESK